MKNRILNIAIGFGLVLTASCSNTDEGSSEQVHDRDFTPVNATITLDFTPVATVVEEDMNVFPFTVTLDEAKPYKTKVFLDYEGTATLGEDFIGPQYVVVSEYETQASDAVQIYNDCVTEDVESLKVTIGARDGGNVEVTPVSFSTDIVNNVDGLNFEADWGGDVPFVVDGETVMISTCDIADMDILIYDATGSLVPVYDGATTNCPESVYLDPAVVGDGVFFITLSNYEYTTVFDDADISDFDVQFRFNIDSDHCGADEYDNYDEDYPLFTLSSPVEQVVLYATVTIENGEIVDIQY